MDAPQPSNSYISMNKQKLHRPYSTLTETATKKFRIETTSMFEVRGLVKILGYWQFQMITKITALNRGVLMSPYSPESNSSYLALI